MSDFVPNRLSLDVSGLMSEIDEAISICIDELSARFQEIIIREIRANGNGSGLMKDEAVRHVKEISRKIRNGVIELEVGVDENISDERARIRTVVVLHGNLHDSPFVTKPGENTCRKHVAYRAMSNAKSVYVLYNLMQFDVSGRLLENSMKEIEKYTQNFLSAVHEAIDLIDFSEYLIVG